MAPGVSRIVRSLLAALALAGMAMPVVGQAQDGHFVVKDMRGSDEATVTIMATKGVDDLPVIALYGANRDVFAKVQRAALEAERLGYGIKAILLGPTNLKPSLEIYASMKVLGKPDRELGAFANAWNVAQPIDPRTIKQAVLVQLIKEVHREYYSAR